MLVLTRDRDQGVVLDVSKLPAGERGLLTVTVVGFRGGKVRLGIEAPPSVVIYRDELHRDDTDLLREGE